MVAMPVSWIHVFIEVPEPWLGAGLDFWVTVTGWPPEQPWSGHPEFQSLEPPDGDAYLHVQQIDGPPRVHLDLVLGDGASVNEERTRHLALGRSPVTDTACGRS